MKKEVGRQSSRAASSSARLAVVLSAFSVLAGPHTRCALARRLRAALGRWRCCLVSAPADCLALPARARSAGRAPCVSYWAAGAVFVGRVEAIKRVGTSRVVIVRGARRIRGRAREHHRGDYRDRPGNAAASRLRSARSTSSTPIAPEVSGSTTSRCSGRAPSKMPAATWPMRASVKQGRRRRATSPDSVLAASRDLAGRTTGVPEPAPESR